jgi:hypothetical protein
VNRSLSPASTGISNEQFVSQQIEPQSASGDIHSMSRGEPGLPQSFTWSGKRLEVASIAKIWKTSIRDRGDLYLRRHWFEVFTTDGSRLKLYCERQTRNRSKPKARWWLYTIQPPTAPPTEPNASPGKPDSQ